MNKTVHLHFYSEQEPAPKPKVAPTKPKTYVAENLFYDSPNESILYSMNGSNWSNIVKGGFSEGLNDVAYGSNFWVAVGNGLTSTSSILYSGNGSNWSNCRSGGFIGWYGNGISYNPTSRMWVAVGQGGISSQNAILYSGNGSNWSNSLATTFTGNYGTGISYSSTKNLWVAVGNSDSPENSILYSGNGTNWTDSHSGGFNGNYMGNYANGISYNPTSRMWVAVGQGDVPENSILYSGNGSNWSNSISGGFNGNYGGNYNGLSIANNGTNLWVAVGVGDSSNNCILYSGNGTNWSNSLNGFYNSDSLSVTYTGSKFLINNSSNVLKSSTDGIHWTTVLSTPFQVVHN